MGKAHALIRQALVISFFRTGLGQMWCNLRLFTIIKRRMLEPYGGRNGPTSFQLGYISWDLVSWRHPLMAPVSQSYIHKPILDLLTLRFRTILSALSLTR